MLKLGNEKYTTTGLKVGNYYIEKVWLCKNGVDGNYVVMGLCKTKTGIARGWWTLASTPSLKDARRFAEGC